MSHPLPLVGTSSSDPAVKGTGVPPKRQRLRCPCGTTPSSGQGPSTPRSLVVRAVTGGRKALKLRGARPSEQELAEGAEHTCELQAWRKRPLGAPYPAPRSGCGPGRPLTPCSLARSITHTRAWPWQPASSRKRSKGRAASIGKQRRDKHPPPPLRAHTRRKPKHNLARPRQFKGPRRARSPNTGKAPTPPRSGQRCEGPGPGKAELLAGFRAKPASLKTRWHFPGSPCPGLRSKVDSPSAWISVPPSLSQVSPDIGRRTGRQPPRGTSFCLFVQPPRAAPARTEPKSCVPIHGCRRLQMPLRASPLHAGSAPEVG